jgi:hypothetical protein
MGRTIEGRRPQSMTPITRLRRRDHWKLSVSCSTAMFIGAILVAWSAAIHLHLWMIGYRHIPSIGPLFLFQSIVGFVIAACVAGTRRSTPALVGIALLASSVGGLFLSAWVGLFGFHDGLDASFAKMSLVVEGAGIAVLTAAVWLRALCPNSGKLGH